MCLNTLQQAIIDIDKQKKTNENNSVSSAWRLQKNV